VFQPPAEPSYHPKDAENKFIELRTSKNETIVACFLDYGYDLTVLFSHGNAEELGTVVEYFEKVFCRRLHVNAFLYDYSGYGWSTGEPSEECLYADVEAAFDYLTRRKGIPGKNIILYGRSLGTGPTVYLAAKYNVVRFRGVVLQSPILSCFRVVMDSPVTLPMDMFANVDLVHKVRSPTMVVHGKLDTVVPFSHGEELYARCDAAVEFLWFEHGGHNDLEDRFGGALFNALRRFFHETTAKWDPLSMARARRRALLAAGVEPRAPPRNSRESAQAAPAAAAAAASVAAAPATFNAAPPARSMSGRVAGQRGRGAPRNGGADSDGEGAGVHEEEREGEEGREGRSRRHPVPRVSV
jgi:pimeloyl-ACP methyl ester carboxylesterase